MDRDQLSSGRSKRRRIFWCVASLPLMAAGCGVIGDGSEKPAPLDTAFNRPNSGVDARRSPSSDRPGLIGDTTIRPDPGESQSAPINGVAGAPIRDDQPANPTGVSETVNKGVISPREAATQRGGGANSAANGDIAVPAPPASSDARAVAPTPPPVTQTATQAKYLQLGSVVVEVNGKPIFANKVIDMITPVLSARAKQVEESRFRSIALEEIRRQTKALIDDELEYATAQRNLDASDKGLADALTQRWRDDQIRKVGGGSLQVTRQQAASLGMDFDEMVKERSRLEMRRVYFQKKELPKMQVTADDMRQYYARHKNDLFTVHERAQFRVIKIDIDPSAGEAEAKRKIEEARARAAGGEEFAALAGEVNDDSYLKRNKGDATGSGGWIDRGAYAVSDVEDAVWKLSPGQVTPPIKSARAFYIAKLEQKQVGRVKGFDDEEVQDQIAKALRDEQFMVLRDSVQKRLLKDAIITPDPPMFEPALEMAMQKYPAWAKKG